MSLQVLVCLVALALVFDFMNGFHDAANSIATIVSTGAMRPQWAIVWAAFFNFIAFLFFGLHVAGTVGKGIIDPLIVDHYVVFGALMDHGQYGATLLGAAAVLMLSVVAALGVGQRTTRS